MSKHGQLLAGKTRMGTALAAAALLSVGTAVPAVAPASASTCPISVSSYGYTLAAAQSALKAVTSTCRTIVFTPGTYQFTGSFNIGVGSVTVTAQPGAVIKAASAGSIPAGLVNVNAAGVTLTGLQLDGAGRARGISFAGNASNGRLSGCTVSNFAEQGVRTQADGTTVSGCTIGSGNGTGIWAFGGASYPSLTNNTVSGSSRMGIEISRATNFTASGNVIHDNHQIGIHVLRSTTGTLSSNTIYDNGSNGIDLHGATGVTVSYNKSYLNGGPRFPETLEGQGIIAYCSQNIKILSNTVWNNSQNQPGSRNGIHISDNNQQNGEMPSRYITIDGNRSYDDQSKATQGYAIRIGGYSSRVGDINFVTITNNTGFGNIKAGIFVKGLAPGATVKIANNSLPGR